MATYKEIKGVTVQTLDRIQLLNVGSWSSGGNLNTARSRNTGGAGTQTAALWRWLQGDLNVGKH